MKSTIKKTCSTINDFMDGKHSWHVKRARIFLSLAIFFVIFCAMILVLIYKERQIIISEAEENAQRLTQLVSKNYQDKVDSIHEILYIVSKINETKGIDFASCHQLYKEFLREYPEYTGLLVADKNGDIVCNGRDDVAITNIADRDFFQLPMENKDFSVGSYQIGRVSKKAIISFSQPVFNDQGDIIRVVALGLNLDWFKNYIQSSNLPDKLVFLLIDNSGAVIANYPSSSGEIGQILPDATLLQAMLKEKHGNIETTTTDGIKRSYTFGQISDQGKSSMYLAFGITKAEIIHDINPLLANDQIEIAIWIVLGLSLIYILGYMVASGIAKIICKRQNNKHH